MTTRKNDIVAVKVTNEDKSTHYLLATAIEVSRLGYVRGIQLAGCSHRLEASYVGTVLDLPKAKQEQAKRLFDSIPRGGREFSKASDLCEAINLS